ncbi:MAG TPA: LysR family transcriptional regulator [Bacillota bacterium]|nr:LysR family transcriptional regulator [Bacillota bacterium]
MELRQIRYFMEVAKREHVTEAANALHVAQSAVSRQIFNLESELGVALFVREGRSVRLTPIGKVFLEHMEQAIKGIDDAIRVVEEYTDPERGTIHIGFPSSLSTYILPTVISAFRDRYPHVKFRLNQGSYYELTDAVVRGDINLALVGPVPTDNKKVASTILFTENMEALLPATHPLSKEKSLRLNQLRMEAFVLYPEGYMMRDLIVQACRQLGFQPRVSFEGEDVDAIKGLVSAGLGVTLLPEVTLVERLPRSTVKIPVVEPNITRTVGIIVPKERQLLPTEKLFFSFVKEFFARLEKFQA